MFRSLIPYSVVFVAGLLLSGCLTAERKVISFVVRPDSTGSVRMTFHNLMSQEDKGNDVSLSDYDALVNRFVEGDEFEQENPAFLNVKKRLYEEGGVLNGEITFDFQSYEDVGLYRYQGKGAWLYYTDPNSFGVEQFDSTNGDYGGDGMPVIFWPEGTSKFEIFSSFDNSDGETRSLRALYRRLGVSK